MRGLFHLLVCVMIATPILGDDGPSSAPQRGKTAALDVRVKQKAQGKKPKAKAPVGVRDPFSTDPFGADPPSVKKLNPPLPPSEDPFGGPATHGQAPSAADPFGPIVHPNTQTAPGSLGRITKARNKARVAPAKPVFPSISVDGSSSSRARIQSQLAIETTFDYLDTPLRDMIDEIALRHDIPIIIDTKALEDFGIGSDTPVTINLRGVSLRSALRLVLNSLELTYVIENEVLQITTPEVADSKLQTRFYPVVALLAADRNGDYLVELIQSHVAPDSWAALGGPGALTYIDHLCTLTVTQTEDVLHQIDLMLAALTDLANS